MITGTQVSNFKGIRSCSLENANLINVLIGKNNACKSTILEAMYYTLKEFIGASLRDVLYRRTNMPIHGIHIWHDYDTQRQATTLVDFDGGIGLRMGLIFENNSIRPLLAISTPGQTSERSGPRYSTSMDLVSHVGYGQNSLLALGNRVQEISNCLNGSRLLDSSMKNSVDTMEHILGILKLRRMTDRFGAILNDVFGFGRTWEFMNPSEDNLSEFRATTKLNDHHLYLDGLGDGMRYCIQIIGNMLLSNSTVLFIEEIENNQHQASLRKLIPAVVNLSITNNIQLFITTHSHEAWRLFEIEFEQNLKERLGEENCRLQSYIVRRNLQNDEMDCLRKTAENANEFYQIAWEELTETPAPPN